MLRYLPSGSKKENNFGRDKTLTSMFGKKERLYADARAAEEPDAPKVEASRPAPRAAAPPVTRAAAAEPVEPPSLPTAGKRSRDVLSSALELAGISSVSVGGFLVAPWLGCMMLGVLLIVLGVAIGYGA